jgi:hypothetical protein
MDEGEGAVRRVRSWPAGSSSSSSNFNTKRFPGEFDRLISRNADDRNCHSFIRVGDEDSARPVSKLDIGMLRQLAREFSGFFNEMLIRIGLAIDYSLEPPDLIGKSLINVGDKTVLKREPHDAFEEYQSYCHGGRVPQRQSNLDRPQAHWSSSLMAYPIPRMVRSNFASPSVSISPERGE